MTDWVRKAMARDLLTRLTLDTLVKLFRHEDAARYLAQTLEPIEFLRSVADHLLTSVDFSEQVIQSAIESVGSAFDELTAEQPMEYQRVLPWRAWRRDGIRVN
jgi:hypothetical protein